MPACGAAKLRVAENLTHVVFDLKFTRQGLKRWAIRYRYRRFPVSRL